MTPHERTLVSRLGGLSVHAKHGSNEIAARARAGLQARFEREADPDETLDLAERLRRAELLRRAHFTRLALRSAQKRSRGKNRGRG